MPNLCAEADVYRASQKGNHVMIVARGSHTEPGYFVELQKGPQDVFPPLFFLLHTDPEPGTHGDPRFSVEASFESLQPIDTVKVTDARGTHAVPVDSTVSSDRTTVENQARDVLSIQGKVPAAGSDAFLYRGYDKKP